MPNTFSSSVPDINGICEPRYSRVADEFAKNFADRKDIGACVSIFHHGKKVVDLWGGFQDRAKTKPWQEDTLTCVMSVSKGIAAIAVLSLVDQGFIKLDDPIANCWPEFAANGKEDITVRCMLSHLAGIPYLKTAPKNALFDEQALFKAIEDQEPYWKPGTTPCYHSFTFGPLCQKLVHQIKHQSMGEYLRNELLNPYDIEILLGLNPQEMARCADIITEENIPSIVGMQDKNSILGKAWKPATVNEELFSSPEFRACEFSSANAHSTARDIAKLYSLLVTDDTTNNSPLISKTTLNDACAEQWDAVEAMTHRHFRYSTGFMLNNEYFKLGPNHDSFGHPGLGGHIGFADPKEKIGFCYCCNHLKAVDHNGDNADALINALYDSLN